ncbi:13128_t:CDS:2 [Cetraspora pellucida]|uniref:13128_t:CDS:1 n=1 Tax=Cetraspora pellucida TaxID=1433469 RepID=A0ACA9LBS4_9GLOM|nr:13128_t:CDS:2 [Cetraspora pellucida]
MGSRMYYQPRHLKRCDQSPGAQIGGFEKGQGGKITDHAKYDIGMILV